MVLYQLNTGKTEFDDDLVRTVSEGIADTIRTFRICGQLMHLSVWTIIRRANKYIDETQPWVLAKDETKK